MSLNRQTQICPTDSRTSMSQICPHSLYYRARRQGQQTRPPCSKEPCSIHVRNCCAWCMLRDMRLTRKMDMHGTVATIARGGSTHRKKTALETLSPLEIAHGRLREYHGTARKNGSSNGLTSNPTRKDPAKVERGDQSNFFLALSLAVSGKVMHVGISTRHIESAFFGCGGRPRDPIGQRPKRRLRGRCSST